MRNKIQIAFDLGSHSIKSAVGRILPDGKIEILSGLNLGDVIVAEGLKKVYPRAEINPIKEGEKKSGSDWKKEENKN